MTSMLGGRRTSSRPSKRCSDKARRRWSGWAARSTGDGVSRTWPNRIPSLSAFAIRVLFRRSWIPLVRRLPPPNVER